MRMDVAAYLIFSRSGSQRFAFHIKKIISESLEAVGLHEEFVNRLPRQLSGGQKQRVAIARAIAPHPKLVILDRWLSNTYNAYPSTVTDDYVTS
ncbi:MAG: ATP-binding cassette domain-containing protein [Candidatus Bathyarchaeia archaeon]|jgi:ABC-type dipeptide/oligopeptide/nickel transport system ATPase subunit